MDYLSFYRWVVEQDLTEDRIFQQSQSQQVLKQETKKAVSLKRPPQDKNPYLTKNMKTAWNSIIGGKNQRKTGQAFLTGNELSVETTHLHIRFKPKNEEELDRIKDDTTHIYTPYPLDLDIPDSLIDGYQDPETPDGQPSFQYCVVEVDKILPAGIEVDILDSLFIPDENMTTSAQANNLTVEAYAGLAQRLEWESLRLTDNLEADDTVYIPPVSGGANARWTPSGRIRVWDNSVPGSVTVTRRVFDHWEYYDCDNPGPPVFG